MGFWRGNSKILKQLIVAYVAIFPVWIVLGVEWFQIKENNWLKFFLNDSGNLSNHFGIYIGTLTGAIISLLFFWIDKKQKQTIKNTKQIMSHQYV